ncbi:MAG: hypothetical protein MRY64_05285 [Hyphomonadaceae bacterium]|nr:hypothetical protein [Hyphomonadaceae bacterium]
MSSSTSSFEVPAFKGRLSSIFVAILIGLMAAAGVIGFNLYMDPLDSAYSPLRAERDRFADFRHNNTAMWAAFDMAGIPDEVFREADIILIGDSRTRSLSGGPEGKRVHRVDGKLVLDLAFGGASIRESLSVYEFYGDRFKPGHIAVLAVPYDRMRRGDGEGTRFTDAAREVKWPILHFLNINTLRYSIEGLSMRERTRAEPTNLPEVDTTTPENVVCERNLKIMDPELEIRNRHRRSILDLPPERAERNFKRDVLPTVTAVKENGGQPVFFFPLYSPRLEDFWQVNLVDRRTAYEELLTQHAPLVRPPGDLFPLELWSDDYHACSPLGMVFMRDIVQQINAM